MNHNMNGILLETSQLTKTFGDKRALDNLTIQMGAGHIVGLVGPNGSGKSTLLRHFIGMYLPTMGSCKTFGISSVDLGPKALARMGYVHQETELIRWMSCREIIRYAAAHYETWNGGLENKLVDLFKLDLKQKVGKMSPGDRQKLSILLAVAYEPQILLLDEPAAALDPLARRHFLELMIDVLQDHNRTILISSHHLNDIEKIVDHMWVLHEGRLLKDSPLDDLQEDYVKLELVSLDGALPETLPFGQVFACERFGGHAMVTMKRSDLSHDEIKTRLDCQVIQHPLAFEDIYPLILEEANPKREGVHA